MVWVLFYWVVCFHVAEVKTFTSEFTFAPFASCGTLWELWCPTEPGSPPYLHFPHWSPRWLIQGRTSQIGRSTKDKDTGLTIYLPFLLVSTAEWGSPTLGTHCMTDGGLWCSKPPFLLCVAPETPQRNTKDTETWQNPSMSVQPTCFLHCSFLYNCGLHFVMLVLWRRGFSGRY